MKIIFIFCFFIIIFEQLNNNFVKACTCLPSTIQHKYCNSDWAARVLILEKEKISGGEWLENIHYTVKFLNVFKDKKGNNYQGQTDCIYTASNTAACGVNFLKINKEYLLFGKYNNEIRNINLCGYYQEWDKIPVNLEEDLYNGIINKNCTN
ncbi:NTR domain-containing protein [Meloidogyne graminicola]|uniref:NTR domain-containing protein n=1 Tax=Meloidogyne graminicola TaxID=189291 RepID=A0A8S9ZYW3_9BILA|nr:NTR domain-containing protein [Meloidogyne graminicola]